MRAIRLGVGACLASLVLVLASSAWACVPGGGDGDKAPSDAAPVSSSSFEPTGPGSRPPAAGTERSQAPKALAALAGGGAVLGLAGVFVVRRGRRSPLAPTLAE